jgi:peptidoglycan biosynthesis protein MviN/MurJ (putative lipid II flippase)
MAVYRTLGHLVAGAVSLPLYWWLTRRTLRKQKSRATNSTVDWRKVAGMAIVAFLFGVSAMTDGGPTVRGHHLSIGLRVGYLVALALLLGVAVFRARRNGASTT